MNKETFVSCMGMMQKMWGKLDDDIYGFYWTRFKVVDDADFRNATSKIIDTFSPTSSEKFPTVARFVQLLGQDEDTRINLAIAAVRKAGSTQGLYRSVSFGDRALHAAIMRFGGWPEVACWKDEDWKFREKSFIQAYKSEMHTQNGPDHLMGLSEEEFDNNSTNWPIERKIAAQKTIVPKQVQWIGYTEIKSMIKSDIVVDNKLIEDLTNKMAMPEKE